MTTFECIVRAGPTDTAERRGAEGVVMWADGGVLCGRNEVAATRGRPKEERITG